MAVIPKFPKIFTISPDFRDIFGPSDFSLKLPAFLHQKGGDQKSPQPIFSIRGGGASNMAGADSPRGAPQKKSLTTFNCFKINVEIYAECRNFTW